MGASVSNAPGEAADVFRLQRRIDVAEAIGLAAPCEIAVDVVAPRYRRAGISPVALCCLPGGYLGRGYFDLRVEGDDSYSFAAFMAARGFVTLSLDHLGSGESTQPEDGYAVTLERVVDANRWAIEKVLGELREPDPGGDRPDFGSLPSVGVGHSMGSALSVVQQARAASHAALVLFSFSARGLEKYLLPDEKKFANRPEETWANLPELARARFSTPYPRVGGRSGEASQAAFGTGTAEAPAVRALKRCGTNLVAQPGLLSMIPGGYGPFAADVRVPVFVGTGDRDLTGPQEANDAFPRAPEFVSYTLEDCWHCHNVARTRHRLWERTSRWIRSVVGPDAR